MKSVIIICLTFLISTANGQISEGTNAPLQSSDFKKDSLDHLHGITTMDVVILQKHILSLEIIESPYLLIAADVNRDCVVDNTDLTQLRNLMVGKYASNQFPNNTAWRYVVEDYEFEEEGVPCMFEEIENISLLDENELEQVIAIKIGDLNGTATPLIRPSKPRYSRIRVDISERTLEELAQLGLEVDHGHIALGRFIENDYSESEIASIRQAGFPVEMIIDDVVSHYKNQLESGYEKLMTEDCFADPIYSKYKTPANFTLGSMGGFYTYQEVVDILADMHNLYPDLITTSQPIGSFTTEEGREILSLVLSKNPDVDEGEPKSLYTSIHHAREPNSLTQLIFFMWYLLENYDTDPIVQEIINNTELHFIPVVNPDGYVYNEIIEPDGGGLWRKNRRDNGDGTFGVDLNRNYGFQWGVNDTGSSPITNSETYRGTAAFSEPETQAIKSYCELHAFNFTQNYHSFGNLLIYPWGYNDSPTPEDPYFKALAEESTTLNTYKYGTGIETVGYNVNGDSDDWMYGEQQTKDRIFSFTPEVGSEGFWPPIDAIVPNCQANVQANLSMALFNLNYPIISSATPVFTSDFDGLITYEVNQLGLQAAAFTVTAEAISDNVFIEENQSFNLNLLETQEKTITFELSSDIVVGDEVVFVIKTDARTPTSADTVRFRYLHGGESLVIVEEIFGQGVFWEADGESWFYEEDDFVSATVSFSDSPDKYDGNDAKLVESKIADLPNEDIITLSFDLKVSIEEGYDFAMLEIIDENGIATPLCGKYSSKGSQFQIADLPVYDGEFGWVREDIDISAWKNQSVSFQLTFISDGFLNLDGILMDDWSISAVRNVVQADQLATKSINIYPNPATSLVRIDMPYDQISSVEVYDVMGRKVLVDTSNTMNVSHLQDGMYSIVVRDHENVLHISTLLIQ